MKQILVFVMLSAILCWFMFAPIYKHVIIVRQAVLQKEVDLLLEIGANGSHGFIDQLMIAESRQRLAERGFVPGDLIYEVSTTSQVSGTSRIAPVLRGTGIQLEITYPYGNLFQIDRLVGITPPAEGSRMAAFGLKMSEYVP
jgi:hypothetical protein